MHKVKYRKAKCGDFCHTVPKSLVMVISVLQVLYPVSAAAAQQSLSFSVIHFPVSCVGISDFFLTLH